MVTNLMIPVLIYLVAAILGIVGIIGFARSKGETYIGMNKNVVGVIGVFLAAVLIMWQVGAFANLGFNPYGGTTQTQSVITFTNPQTGQVVTCPVGYTLINGACQIQAQQYQSNAGANGITPAFGLVDAQSPGTKVSVPVAGNNCRLYNNGVAQPWTTCPTTMYPGQMTDFLLVNGTQYHNVYVGANSLTSDDALQTFLGNPQGTQTITANTFPLGGKANANTSVSDTMTYQLTGLVLTASGGANNITGGNTNGNSFTILDNMQGTALTSTQDMVCVDELSNGTSATSTGVNMAGNGAVIDSKWTGTPSWYTAAGASSRVWIYDIPALTSAQLVPYTITLQALSTKSFGAGTYLKKTCYTKEYFIDPNSGLITYDVADSNNLVKSMAQYTETVYFSA